MEKERTKVQSWGKKEDTRFTVTDQAFEGLVHAMKSMLDEDLVPQAKPA